MSVRIAALRRPPPIVLEALPPDWTVDIIEDPSKPWNLDGADQVRGLINFSGQLNADTLARFPALEIVSHMGVGYDGVDVAAALARGITVTHTRDVLNADVANFAFLMLLAASRNLAQHDALVRRGAWPDAQPPLNWSIEGKTVGIVGLGRIGKNLAQKLRAFNVTVLYHGRSRQDVPYEFCPDLTEMARRSTALVLLVPGGSGTDGLITAAILDAIGPDGGLVNVARGSVVDEPALIAALSDGRLGWAALDVFANEPNVPEALRALPNVLLAPHVASATVETRGAMFALVAENLRSWFETGTAVTPIPECDAGSRRGSIPL